MPRCLVTTVGGDALFLSDFFLEPDLVFFVFTVENTPPAGQPPGCASSSRRPGQAPLGLAGAATRNLKNIDVCRRRRGAEWGPNAQSEQAPDEFKGEGNRSRGSV